MSEKQKQRPLLLIDDSDDIRDVFKVWIELEGYSIQCVSSGSEALKLLRQGLQPCMVLVDLSMPDMTGSEFLKAAHGERLLEHSPVYIFSAQSQVGPVPGAQGWIKKPIDLEQVLTILRELDPPCAPLVSAP